MRGMLSAWLVGCMAVLLMPVGGMVAAPRDGMVAAEVQAMLDPAIARFRRFDARDGLSQDSVLAIAEDAQGLIWLGTQDGLNRFDGFDLKILRPDFENPNSLPGPWAGRLAFDGEGHLWVGSTAGLARLDPRSGEVWRMSAERDQPGALPGQTVLALHGDGEGRIWVGTDAGLSLWQVEQQGFLSFVPPAADPRVLRLTSSSDGSLWVGTLQGVYRFSPESGQFDQPGRLASIRDSVSALLLDQRDRLWVGTEAAGLWRIGFDPTAPSADHFRQLEGEPSSLGDERIRSLLQDRDRRIWIGHETGLDRLDDAEAEPDQARFAHYRHGRHDSRSLGRGAVVSLLQDRHGDLWVGTWEGGVGILSPALNRMISLNPDVRMAAAMRAASVRSLLPDADGWWLAGEDGVYRYQNSPRNIRLLPGSEGLFTFELHRDAYQPLIWIGSSRGLWQLQTNGEVLLKPEQPPRIRNARVRRVLAEPDRIWLALMPEGILVLERSSLREVAFYPIGGIVSFIRPLNEQIVLVGAQDGLYWFDRQEAVLRYRHVVGSGADPAHTLPAGPTSMMTGVDGKTWFGSSGAGLLNVEFDQQARPEETRFESFDRRLGLAADSVGWLEEDQHNRIWLSTTVGVSSFDRSSLRFRNYEFDEGTLGRSYWIGAGGKSPSGTIAFGGFDGLTLLHPSSFHQSHPPAPPRLSAYALGSQWTDVLGRADVPTLQLPASDKRSLSFRFTALEHILPRQLRFEYRLLGFDDDWIEAATGQRIVNFTNLPPGQFQFELRSRDADGQLSEQAVSLPIKIVPSWWQTTWARVLAVVLLLAVVVLWGRYRLTRAQRQNAWLKQRVQERTADIEQLVEIGRELAATLDLEQAMERVYQRVSARLDTHVFAIAVFDQAQEILRELYVREAGQRAEGLEIPLSEQDRPAVWCIRERQPLITARQSELLNYVSTNLPAAQGDETESIVYLPLVVGERVIGCLTVQSLRCDAYHADQLAFLEVLASYSAIAIDNALNYQRLDDTVAQRTHDILTLAEIGRELTATLDPEQAMQQVYEHVSDVLDTFVFFIGWLEDDERTVRLAFAVEAGRRQDSASYSIDEPTRPGAMCIRESREIIVQTEQEMREQLPSLGPPLLGLATQSMVFIPLIHDGRARGYLSVQSLRKQAYNAAQLEFLRVLASYTAIALENARSYQVLDQAVATRTAELQQALEDLRSAQRSLIEREKMASLGGLVAGVAHEVNTPLGIAVTAASHLEEEARSLFASLDRGDLTRSAMADFRAACDEGLRLISGSLRRAHVLIGSFKRVAVDQSSEERRRFDLLTTLEEILFSLRPSYRRAGHQLILECPAELTVDSYPGALFQVITNLVTNAAQHAFADAQIGTVRIDVLPISAERLVLKLSDDGRGMDASTQARIFDPFFTTRRSSGGSGLGMHLVYNLVTQLLGGSIRVSSTVGQGTCFEIELPVSAPSVKRHAQDSAAAGVGG
ncbi:GAF domain-containing protein [Pseudomarimonas arenosa]|uniref:histidine kinase n=1 Tax=Pseudomarimonas arenosa TaxID=2774145 RepID=A0AAW3ZP66_9GAMM|nr:GAF domain-containing protein [Pseudomarimonas arenosa]MBD8527314.1 GAF domain-containing protein [Pseudomarimonas arenosa]